MLRATISIAFFIPFDLTSFYLFLYEFTTDIAFSLTKNNLLHQQLWNFFLLVSRLIDIFDTLFHVIVPAALLTIVPIINWRDPQRQKHLPIYITNWILLLLLLFLFGRMGWGRSNVMDIIFFTLLIWSVVSGTTPLPLGLTIDITFILHQL